ncbi:ATP-binding protein [Pedosphaera parvula]|uniref:histidine kinase n=1 Tax=Pedosphaera parvula (strain Ellin514) TaxID=320771 RepID=B9XM51_PEDPL|nr:ATP-binding protein [Pedosphaera parvula]EEF59044.1 multi-sensor signal transduction histidine kinase [Pedosphaera parvula Ellin514]
MSNVPSGESKREAGVTISAANSVHYLEAVCNHATVALFIVNEHRQCVYMNPAAEKLTGFSFAEVHGQILHELMHHTHPNGTPYLAKDCPLDRSVPEKHQLHGEDIFIHKDGHFYPVAYTVSPIHHQSGGLVGSVVELTDISQRKKDENILHEQTRSLQVINRVGALLAAELDLQKIVQAATDAGREITGAQFGAFFYNVTDRHGDNYTLYTLSGIPREAFAKFPMPRATHLFGPTFRGEGIVRIGDVLKDPRYGRNAPYHGMPKGHLPVRSYLAVPVISRSGEVLGGLFFGHAEPDVFTANAENILKAIAGQAAIAIDNAQLYAKVQHQAEELEEKVQKRTESLREALAQMQEFSYSVSHDLRAPLRAIQGYSRVLLDEYAEKLGTEGRSYLTRMALSSERLDQLTRDVLTLSRLGREDVELKPIQLKPIIQDIVQTYPRLQPPQTELTIVESLLDVIGHESLLTQVISNLLVNASKFVAADIQPCIRIWTEADGDHVRLWIEDNGMGIKPEHHERIFRIFERGQADSSYEGTGIGLAIVRRAVERMEGTVGVESDGATGSRFWVQLPKAPAVA